MAANFKIFMHRNDDNLHLKLMGDFDGSSACELINVLKKSCNNVYRVIIHTSCIGNIIPFGQDVFKKNLSNLNGLPLNILFTGEHANQIVPEKTISF
ncbi:MAG: hypothetical protein JW786_12115 [Desulfobacterales bacterium]|nr:hypothetical protein [Desulfobacterales bacterium]